MNRNTFFDLVSICIGSGKGLRETFSTIKQLRILEKHAKSGAKSGYCFDNLNFECIDPHYFSLLFTEIFIAEPYFFITDKSSPLVIDGGVNIGLSVAYFKKMFPKSRIIGFEPHPTAYEVAKSNFEHNSLSNIELIHAALDGDEGDIQLSFIPNEIMASTTGDRLLARGAKPETMSVKAVKLSNYISEEVDFLKLDIEGAEQRVLEEMGDKLSLVKNMFVEFHLTRGDSKNSLPKTLSILEEKGFDYLITSTLGTRRNATFAPLLKCGPISSLSIFAKRIDDKRSKE
jgi:FkbM family methyltransferase